MKEFYSKKKSYVAIKLQIMFLENKYLNAKNLLIFTINYFYFNFL